MPFAVVGPNGLLVEGLAAVPNKLASTVMNIDEDPVRGVDVPVGVVVLAVNVPDVMAICTFCAAGAGAFWCGFQSDGINQASSVYVVTPDLVTLVQEGLKTNLFK